MGGAGSLGRMAADREADTKVPAADRAAPRAFRRRTRISAAPGSAGAAGVPIDWRGGDFAHLPIYGGDGDPGGWPPLGPRGGVVARGSVPVPFVQRMPASGGGCGCGSVARPDEECEACRAQPVAGLSVQRAPAATATEPAIAPSAAPNWLVEDSGPSPAPGQATKSQWLTALREAICARADRELAGTRQSSQGCPLIAFWIGYFAGRDAAEVSAAAVRYAPELARVSNARDAIPPIVARVGEAVRVWVKTGKVTGIPAGAAALGGAGSAGAAPADAGVQRKPLAEGTSTAGQPNPAALLHRLGPGQPLDSGVRSRMEPALGQDLSAVRLHVDREAASMSSGLDARAFTVGNHIALAPGEYQPGTIAGDALLAHELAHVIQQSGAAPGCSAAPRRLAGLRRVGGGRRPLGRRCAGVLVGTEQVRRPPVAAVGTRAARRRWRAALSPHRSRVPAGQVLAGYRSAGGRRANMRLRVAVHAGRRRQVRPLRFGHRAVDFMRPRDLRASSRH